MSVNQSNSVAAKAAKLELARRAALSAANAKVSLFDKTKVELPPERWNFWLSKCHAKQRLFLRDAGRLKALICPRRTGKSTATLFDHLIAGEMYPGSAQYYVVPDSKSHARRLFWVPLQKLNDAFKLGLQFYEADKRVVLPGEAQIYLFGAHDKDAAKQLRGDALSKATLDECKDFGPHFEEVMIEAILPALGDYQGGLNLAGTPGGVLDGMFYKITSSKPEGWSVHNWIKSDNEFLPPEERDLDKVWESAYKPFGLSKTSPKFRREQLAEWVADDDERLYAYDAHRNGWDGRLPESPRGAQEWMYTLGLDLGEKDATAFIVWAFSLTDRHCYLVDQYARSYMSIDEINDRIQGYMVKYPNFVHMWADTGGYGRGIVTDLQDRHGLPLEVADKGKNKLGNIALMNSAFLSGRIKCPADTPLAREWLKLTKRLRITDRKWLLDHSDLADAALYGWKAAYAWAASIPSSLPQPGTQEAWHEQEKAAILEATRNRKGREWYGKALSDET